MANKDDYLVEYRQFFENFAKTNNPNDQLPVTPSSYKLANTEVVGAIIDWSLQYLSQKKCPQSLLSPLISLIIEETRKTCKKQPTIYGFNPDENVYEPLKLMQTVMSQVNEICLRYLDNSKLCSLPSPTDVSYYKISAYAVKNSRRKMEDRHVIIHDLNTMFNIQDSSPSSFYAIFDGHAGYDAAAYSAAHLHQFLAENSNFCSDPKEALLEAFLKTDALFVNKCKIEALNSGTTAVCALFRPKEKMLYIAWVGDSQALLVKEGKVLQCVHPHKPCREDEKNRIEKEGGAVLYWGTWRVNGQLAVSRAIGDVDYKPYVTAIPDVREIELTGNEDFLIIACDGLWDFLSEDDAANSVYELICKNSEVDVDYVSQRLVQLAKEQGSNDNISVIVVFLRDLKKIAAEARWADRNGTSIMDASLNNVSDVNNPFAVANGPGEFLGQKNIGDSNLLTQNPFAINLAENFSNCDHDNRNEERTTNGKRHHENDEFDEDDDLGPETDVDAVDDSVLSPTSTKSFSEGLTNNNVTFNDKLVFNDNFMDQDTNKFEEDDKPVITARDETPTPPADLVHDTSTLVDNVADSGEESEDEWNYFQGDSAEKKGLKSTEANQELTVDLNNEVDNMSQLNPNAAEFIPVSPKRNVASPQFQSLLNEPIIAQSPKKASPAEVDITVPDIQDFEKEIKSRPSDVLSTANGHETENNKLPSQKIMENLLNGKSIDEIEFQPSTPIKPSNSDEFYFGTNPSPFTPAKLLDQSEALSTKANFGEETTASYMNDKDLECEFVEKADVSSEKTEKTENFDVSDLNKVQLLPEKIEDFLKDESNSSLNQVTVDQKDIEDEINNQKSVPITTDLDSLTDNISSDDQVHKPDELSTSVEKEIQEHEPEKENKDPKLSSEMNETVFEVDQAGTPELSPFYTTCKESPNLQSPVKEEINILSTSNVTESFAGFEENLNQSENKTNEEIISDTLSDKIESSVPQGEENKNLVDMFPMEELNLKDIQQQNDVQCDIRNIHSSDQLFEVPNESFSQISCVKESVVDLPQCEQNLSFEQDQECIFSDQKTTTTTDLISPESELLKSPEPEIIELSKSQVPDTVKTPEPDVNQLMELSEPVVHEVHEIPTGPELERKESPAEEITSSVKDETSAPMSPIESEEAKSPKQYDSESVATTDVNSFLNRTGLSDVASPLSPETEIITSHFIQPEFAEKTVMSPTEDIKIEEEEIPLEKQDNEVKIGAVNETITSSEVKPITQKTPTTTTSPSKQPQTKSMTSKSTTATPKTPSLRSTTTPSSASKISSKVHSSATSKVSSTPTPSARKSLGTSPATSAKSPLTKPKTLNLSATKPPTTKKPLTNGDCKVPDKKPAPIEKRTVTSTMKSSGSKLAQKTTSAPLKPTGTGVSKLGLSNPTSKATLPAKPPASKPQLGSIPKTTRMPAKPPVASSLSKTSATTLKSTTTKTGNVTSTRTATSSLNSAPKPKPPSTTTVPSRLKLPLTKTTPKSSPDTEKQLKESANKKITAAAKGTLIKKTTTNVSQKTDVKVPPTKTGITKTTTKSAIGKKPTENHNANNKLKTTTTVTKSAKIETNGIVNEIQEITTTLNVSSNNSEPQLMKDLSPLNDNAQTIDNFKATEVTEN